MPAAMPAVSSTKSNSPPCDRTAASGRASAILRRATRPTSVMTMTLPNISASVSASTVSGRSITSDTSTDMPTAMKNSPSSSPLKGSMLASSS